MVHSVFSELNASQRHTDLLREAEKRRQIKRAGAKNRDKTALTGRHAAVIGGGIAGLAAAQVLTKYAGRVTLIDRDHLDSDAEFRRGVPQARHAHSLLPSGQRALERLFPGIVDELLRQGAVAIDPSRDMAFYHAGAWHKPRSRSDGMSVGASRPLLESALFRRVADHPRVRIVQGAEAIGLSVDETGAHVTGVRLRDRKAASLKESRLVADLVVDASGRGSRANLWLQDLGFAPPRETIIDAFAGYASRIYRRPAGFSEGWSYLYIRPTAPDEPRGGVILPMEEERWHVTLFGVGRDYPPTDEAGFLTFARGLPTGRMFQAIEDAQPLTRPNGYRRTENRLRHYDRMERYLEGFLVTGDAAYTLNPVYALGMTAALLGSQALEISLRRQQGTGGMDGLARSFQKRLRKAVTRPLKMATSEDRRWPTTDVIESGSAAQWHEQGRSVMPTLVGV